MYLIFAVVFVFVHISIDFCIILLHGGQQFDDGFAGEDVGAFVVELHMADGWSLR